MESILINRQMGFEDLINHVEQLDKTTLLQFVNIVNGLVSKNNQTADYEAQLLKKIKTSIPASLKKRQKELYVKMQDNTLRVPERDELTLLNGIIEDKTAEKIRFMGELAQLRGITLGELNRQFNQNKQNA